MTFRLAANFPVFHRQVSHVPYPRRQFVAAATSLYVLRDNLFHVRAEKPFRPLLVGANNLLVERRFGKLSCCAALLRPRRRLLQFRQIRAGDQQIVAHINQQWSVRRGCHRPRIANHLQRSLRRIRS